ncbi:thiamine phosphate synthase [bacterium endosymbiont of Bathymodiolus sp. 5 South]|uniref:thiamine phosphate synthase n=1 Tax=bacterium endosymbiont of Bathymodiolus sp. 5 South TaxID=1181670 RepID=UPI0010B9D064|nr:thiamine phosphate synthase [bacterium endosymbiont of Bathymodiolus sp. 5 South]CAC9436833.1 Thiamin-phosphate pyrophosphorylase (EC 2.5.1.3) [uncultured Gammaproteobacteria bacterium]CAC9639184.1 Thiamin-phosphate pyrophosphorylase (EC 2.5.1.3) [uncultured Gammaproteobacteria bacterium]SHN90445.1 Thiamin-phosphate pyrophosphorylase [bacterium endosymbiont of Bathymodiolus sp. 5 South]VVH55350.1 Thiamin-phosphate pyrophosphorylase (EC [uncultured Gammaproteobacteria bacterium]VVH62345.1 Th
MNIKTVEKTIVQHNIKLLQYRHKTVDVQTQLNESLQLQQLCLKHHTLFIINDDINLAKKISADGVHLGKNDASIQQAREQLGIDAVIGVSCYNAIDLAQSAQNQDANYVAFGALFPSVTKPDAPQCHLNVVAQARQILDIPIVGIGGINFDNQQQAFDAGCSAVAMIAALWD